MPGVLAGAEMNADAARRQVDGEDPAMFQEAPSFSGTNEDDVVLVTQDFQKSRMARSIPHCYWGGGEGIKWWVINKVDIDPRTSVILLKLFPQLGIQYQFLFDLQASLRSEVRPFDNATPYNTGINAPNIVAALAKDGFKMYDYQALDLGYLHAQMRRFGGCYIGWDRGLGKTLGSCAIIDELGDDGKQVLVVAPNTAKVAVWKPEIERFLPAYEVIVLPNAKPQRIKCLAYVADVVKEGRPFVLIIHYEAINIIGQGHTGKMGGKGWHIFGTWDVVICDEVHRIKNSKALMAKAIKKVPSIYRIALSGSIIENHAEELFSPLQWLFPNRYKRKWADWNDRFLDYNEGGYGKVLVGIKPDQLANLQAELGVFMCYRRKKDELDLPPRTDQQLFVDISAGQRKAYTEMAQGFLAKMPDGSQVKAVDGLSMLTKLRQIASGLDLVTDEVQDSTKIDLALEMIEDAEDEAFVVFSWYKAMAYSLAARLGARGIASHVVTGDVKQEDRSLMIEEFQAANPGSPRVFIGTLKTLGESVNLQRSNQVILLDRSWNPMDNAQAEDRVYRMGQDKPVTITHIIARDTVDEHRVLPTITNKEALRGMILGG